jgi:hypothetical protein
MDVLRSASPKIAYFREFNATNTPGGSSTASAWASRLLNQQLGDTSFATLGNGGLTWQILVLPGTYYAIASGDNYYGAGAQNAKLRLRDFTNSVTLIHGMNWYSGSSGSAALQLQGVFTLTTARYLELQQFNSGTQASNGLGDNMGQGDDVYSQLTLIKVG